MSRLSRALVIIVLLHVLDQPLKWNKTSNSYEVDPSKAEVLRFLASQSLWAMAFLFAYFQFGLVVACTVMVVFAVLYFIYRQREFGRYGIALRILQTGIIVLFGTLTIAWSDLSYLQLIPTVLYAGTAFSYLLFGYLDLQHLLWKPRKPRIQFWDQPNNRALMFLTAAVLSEILRAYLSTEVWIWFFSMRGILFVVIALAIFALYHFWQLVVTKRKLPSIPVFGYR